MPASCPARLLVVGDRFRLPDGTHAVVTSVYPLPGKVELTWMDDGCRIGSAIVGPDVEVLMLATAAEQVA